VGFIKLHLITDKREGSKIHHFWWAGWIVANYCLNFPNNCFRRCSAHRLKGKQELLSVVLFLVDAKP
jgi:hypothetical protein